MGEVLDYTTEVIRALELVAQDPRSVFLCQSIFGGGGFTRATASVPDDRRLEVPPSENLQMGMSIGMSLAGMLPVSTFLRYNFMYLGWDQLVNHLDRICDMGSTPFKPKVIVRVQVGGTKPLRTGPQHCDNATEALRHLLRNIVIVRFTNPRDIVPAYQAALASDKSYLMVEYGDLHFDSASNRPT